MKITNERQAKQHIVNLVKQVKVDSGSSFPWKYQGIDDPLAKFLHIKIKEIFSGANESIWIDGSYVPDSEPTIIIRRGMVDSDRLNFTFFHEIMHHLIRQDDELYNFIHELSANDDDFENTLEYYCNLGAAEFLLPAADLTSVMSSRGFSVRLVADLDLLYPISKPAIAIQLAQCATHQCIVLVCEYGIPPNPNSHSHLPGINAKAQPILFVQYSASSPSVKYRGARFVNIPRNHIIETAYQEQKYIKGHDRIPFRSGTDWRTNCEALYYQGKVYVAFNLTAPVSQQQIPLRF